MKILNFEFEYNSIIFFNLYNQKMSQKINQHLYILYSCIGIKYLPCVLCIILFIAFVIKKKHFLNMFISVM